MAETLEDQLKRLIVDTLALEDVSPESIETEAPL
ncbi:MAG TPA: acyl carrier protein, partial [Planctomycetota bacterium]|nr:acyl carrier protein [Planctomycetota bacterium]